MLADGGRFVIRYDHRDTGRSVTYEPGHPDYSGADLVADAAGVLDAYGLSAAHIVGVSAGGAFAQLLALDFADRVLSLVLISTSPATPGDRGLPPPTEEFGRFVATAEVDWSDPESVIEYLVGYSRVLNGGERHSTRRHPVRSSGATSNAPRNVAALQNHDAPLGRRSTTRAAVVDQGSHAGDPRHGRSDVPARARGGAGGGDSRRNAAGARREPGTASIEPTGPTIVPAILEHTRAVRSG